MLILPRRRLISAPATFTFDGFAAGAITLSMPTHYAPAGSVSSILILAQCNSYQTYTAPPDLPTGGGWTGLGASFQYSGRGGYNFDIRYAYKVAASAAEILGTVNAAHVNSVGVWSLRCSPIPGDPATLFATAAAATTGFTTVVNWQGLTIGANSRVLSTLVSGAGSDGNHVQRTGFAAYTKNGSGNFGYGYTDEISTWASTTSTFGAATGAVNLCLEFKNPGSV